MRSYELITKTKKCIEAFYEIIVDLPEDKVRNILDAYKEKYLDAPAIPLVSEINGQRTLILPMDGFVKKAADDVYRFWSEIGSYVEKLCQQILPKKPKNHVNSINEAQTLEEKLTQFLQIIDDFEEVIQNGKGTYYIKKDLRNTIESYRLGIEMYQRIEKLPFDVIEINDIAIKKEYLLEKILKRIDKEKINEIQDMLKRSIEEKLNAIQQKISEFPECDFEIPKPLHEILEFKEVPAKLRKAVLQIDKIYKKIQKNQNIFETKWYEKMVYNIRLMKDTIKRKIVYFLITKEQPSPKLELPGYIKEVNGKYINILVLNELKELLPKTDTENRKLFIEGILKPSLIQILNKGKVDENWEKELLDLAQEVEPEIIINWFKSAEIKKISDVIFNGLIDPDRYGDVLKKKKMIVI